MRRSTYILFLGLMWILFGSNAQTVAIKDSNFRKCLQAKYPTTVDAFGNLIISESQKITSISCGFYGISSVEELKYFSSLSYLYLPKNTISLLPEFVNPQNFTGLNIGENPLVSLPDFSKFTNLDYLSIHKLDLVTVPDLTKNTKLKTLILKGNDFNSIPAINLPDLEYLDVSATKIAQLPDISNCKKLKQIDCYGNKISTLPDLSSYDSLSMIDACTNYIKKAPVMPMKIKTLFVDNNLLEALPDLKQYSLLSNVRIYNNNLTFSDLQPLLSFPNYLNVFRYSPQNPVKIGYSKTIVEREADSIVAKIDLNVPSVSRSWYFNKALTKQTTYRFEIDTMTADKAGAYVCKWSSTSFPNLVLSTDTFKLKYLPCVNANAVTWQITPASCIKQGAIEAKMGNQPKSNYTYVLKCLENDKVYASSNGVFNHLSGINYQLSLNGARNCKHVIDTLIVPKEDCKQVVLTPNDDNIDEAFFFAQNGSVDVVDKWGANVGKLAIPKMWDGKVNGTLLPVGYYILNINNGAEVLKLSIIY